MKLELYDADAVKKQKQLLMVNGSFVIENRKYKNI